MKAIVDKALSETRGLWPDIARAYEWIHSAATILANNDSVPGCLVRNRLDGLVAAMKRHKAKAGKLAPAIEHFLKVTQSLRAHLFFCYDDADIPRTNNGLEQAFGSFRQQHRRATGRKTASRRDILRGPVCLPSCLATRQRKFDAADLAGIDPQRMKSVRAELRERTREKCLGRSFRRDPKRYLLRLESLVLKLGLPP